MLDSTTGTRCGFFAHTSSSSQGTFCSQVPNPDGVPDLIEKARLLHPTIVQRGHGTNIRRNWLYLSSCLLVPNRDWKAAPASAAGTRSLPADDSDGTKSKSGSLSG